MGKSSEERYCRMSVRNAKIRKMYNHLYHKLGKRSAVALKATAEHFYMAENTIAAVISQTGTYKPPGDKEAVNTTQLDLFNDNLNNT